METPSAEPLPPVTLAPCSQSCRFAEPLGGDYSDWMWCTRPEASVRVTPPASDCAAFEPR
jgi:hypothetical protein